MRYPRLHIAPPAALAVLLAAGCGTDFVKSAEGDSCTRTDDCASGLRCKGQVCQKPKIGDPCSSNSHCGKDQTCDDTLGKCVAAGSGTDGGPPGKDGMMSLADTMSQGQKNVQACNQWKQTMSSKVCGSELATDYTKNINCNQYSSYNCSLAAYWQCLTDQWICNGSQVDVTGWPQCAQNHVKCP